MSDYTSKNVGKHASRSRKGMSVPRHNVHSDLDVRAEREAERLTKNRTRGAYSDAGIGIVPISILT